MQIQKQHSTFLKGVAILFMLYHQLFFYPERMDASVTLYRSVSQAHIEALLAGFGQICLPMFLFLSGYGFGTGRARSLEKLAKKVVELYYQFWLVFVLFIPLGALLFNQSGRYDLSVTLLLQNLTALNTTYNAQWGFLILYVACVSSLPVLYKLNNFTLIFVSAVLMTGCTLLNQQVDYGVLQHFLWYGIWLFPFACGLVFARNQQRISQWLAVSRLRIPAILASVVAAPLVYILLMERGYMNIGLSLLTPVFIFLLVGLYRFIPGFIRGGLSEVGRHSTFIWLTHAFFCYDYFQQWIYSPHYPGLIFLLLLAVTWLASVLLTRIYNLMLNKPMVSGRQLPY